MRLRVIEIREIPTTPGEAPEAEAGGGDPELRALIVTDPEALDGKLTAKELQALAVEHRVGDHIRVSGSPRIDAIESGYVIAAWGNGYKVVFPLRPLPAEETP